MLFWCRRFPRGRGRRDEGKYLRFAGSAGYAHIKDAGASPLRYHGAGMLFSMAFIAEDRDATWGARGDMSLAAGFAASRYMQSYGNLRFDIYFPASKIPRLTGTNRQIQAGASWLSEWDSTTMRLTKMRRSTSIFSADRI
ncbi:MAG: hypothetical protein U5N26_05245 [Candidatus Marinimicrobia bacterium]|nr:hypothetical protein [Candidatus Neomarinimicrobiota bacterium]